MTSDKKETITIYSNNDKNIIFIDQEIENKWLGIKVHINTNLS